ncbi:PKD domain-containing protein [Salegentibacter sediminis]|uniref:PKD domain-containing protein n=1 Tax=Salegentibacter sediminis TaxID=1930251 RepID=UPI0009BDA51E|nr:PKD domain-containing protein [Salegentibacter sediminis]
MGKKLLVIFFIFSLFLLNSRNGFGQCTDNAPSVTISTTSGAILCESETISFTSTISPSSQTEAYTYQWQVKVGNNAYTDISGATGKDLNNYAPAIGNNRFQLIVTYCSGTTDEKTVISPASGIITVYKEQTGNVSIQADKTEICPGEEVVYSITNINNHGGSSAQYEWLLNNQPFSPAEATTTLKYSPTGSDVISLRVNSGTPCVDDFTSSGITVKLKPGTPNQPTAIQAPALICPGVEEEYNISAVTNATEYLWTLPDGTTETTASTKLLLSINTPGSHTLSVQAVNECGTSPKETIALTVNTGIPDKPGPISAPVLVCPGIEETYSISPVSDADDYIWTLPDGSNQTTSSPEIKWTFNNSGQYNISVAARNECGTGIEETLSITVNDGIPSTPAVINGPTEVCPGEMITYSVTNDNTVTNYEWSLPSGWTLTINNGNEIEVTAGNYNQNGQISVIAKNDCGNNAPQTLSVEVKPGIPAQPEISGVLNACTGTEEIYTISEIDFAEEYTWEFPSGWNVNNTNSNIVTVAAGTTSVNVLPGTNGGTLSVFASNSCGDSTADTETLNIEDPAPAMPGAITYPNSGDGEDNKVCLGTAGTYTIAPVPTATSYIWTLPDSTTQTTTEPELVYTATSAGTLDLSVQAVNNCGASTAKEFEIVVTDGVPAQPGAITSTSYLICPPATLSLSVPNDPNALGYEWFLPSGWDITGEKNTNSITVNVSASAQYSNPVVIGVEAFNICGNSTRRETPANLNDANAIAISDYVFVDLGEDLTLCSTNDPVSLDAQLNFGGKKLKVSSLSSSSGVNINFPSGAISDLSFNYTPSGTDLANGSVTITIITEKPNGACDAGEDAVTLYFRDDPTAQIIGPSEAICTGTETEFSISGTPNTTVTYSLGGVNSTVELGNGDGTTASTTLSTGTLTENTSIVLVSSEYTDGDPGCPATLNDSIEIEVTPIPTATISYSGPYCNSGTNTIDQPNLQGEHSYQNGSFTATGDLGNYIDDETGVFIPAEVDPGTYTVTYTIPSSGGCESEIATTEVSITELPSPEISYAESPFCSTVASGDVTLTGGGNYQGGTFTSTSGLDINPETGQIDPTNSTAGDYTVTYTLAASEGCELVETTTDITITEKPEPEISYTANEICEADTNTYQATLSGTGLVTGGIFSAPSGLSIDSESGLITPANSNPGTYIITYTLDTAGDGCDEVTTQTEITITEIPSVTISYPGPYCASTTGQKAVEFTNKVGAFEGGSFTSTPDGLSIDGTTGDITPSGSDPGEYTITYTIPASGGCESEISETTVIITAVPGATINYENAPFCTSDSSPQTPVFSETVGAYDTGSFSGTSGLEIDSQGNIIPSESTAGVHTVTYTIPATEACEAVTTTVEIEIFKEVSINSQPFDIGTCSGEDVSFEVSATGDGLSYQWYFEDGTEVPGATSEILEFSSANSTNSGTYYVEVSGAGPCASVASNLVTLTVDENITIETPPQDEVVCLGDDVEFVIAASATGGEVQYQWLKDGVEISGATNATLNLTSVELSDAAEYSVFIEGPAGYSCSTITSGVAVLSVNEPPVVEAGNNFEVCSTTTVIDVGNGATASNHTSLIWTSNGLGVISNATSLNGASYEPHPDDIGETIEFTLTAILEVGEDQICAEAVDTREITIIPQPVITEFSYIATDNSATSGEFCETDETSYLPYTAGDYLNSGTGEFSVNKNDLSLNSTTGEFTPNGTSPGVYILTYTYTINSEEAGCTEAKKEFTVTIGEKPIADFSYDTEVYCKDTRDNTLNTDPVISFDEGHDEFDSFVVDNNGLELDPDTGAIDLSTSAAGTYIITRTVDYSGTNEDGCQPVTAEFTITINEKPIPDFTYAATEFCSDPEMATTISPVLSQNGSIGEFTYAATPTEANLVLDSATGDIDLANSDAGSFTIINTVDLTGENEDSCGEVSHEFTINISKQPKAAFEYTQTDYCISQTSATVKEGFQTGGSFSSTTLGNRLNPETGEITWTINDSGIIGNHTITYTVEGDGACVDAIETSEITIDALPLGGELKFSSGRIFMTCENAVSGYAEDLILSGHEGEIVEWEYRNSNSTQWTPINNTTNKLEGTDIEMYVNNVSTVFRAVITNGACDNKVYSATAIVSVIPSNIKPSPVEVDPEVLCFGSEIQLSSETGYGEEFGKFEGGDFTDAGIKNKGWNFTDPDGNEIDYNANADSGNPIHWHKTQPKWKFETADINTNEITGMWWNPLSDGKTNEHFAIAQSTYDSNMDTPTFNLTGMDEAVLTFDQAFNLTANATIRVVLLKNGTEYKELYKITGPASSGYYEGFADGTPGVNNMTFDLGSYLGETGLKIRFEFRGERNGDIWAVDNIKVPEGPQDVLLQWFYDEDINDSENVLEQIGQDNEKVVTFVPRKIGWNDFEVKTAILLDSNGNACESLDNSETIRVFVFDQYTTEVEAITGPCGNYTAKLNATTTGDFQGEIPVTDYPTIDGYIGAWVIEGPEEYILTNQDSESELDPVNNPNIIFEAENFGDYTISWELTPTIKDENGEIIENTGCPPIHTPVELPILACTTLDFDGIDDYVDLGNNYNGNHFIEAWIRPFDRPLEDGSGTTDASNGVIFSSSGFEIRMENLPAGIQKNTRWYHIAVANNGDLWVDGIPSGNITVTGSGINNTSIGARYNANTKATSNHFSGWIEELRIWNNAPSQKEIRFMMNQRLKLDGTGTVITPLEGEIIPNRTVAGSYNTLNGNNLDWQEDPFYDQTAGDLAGYYRLISEAPDPSGLGAPWGVNFAAALMPQNGETPDLAINKIPGRLHNMTTNQENTAPLPYISAIDGKIWAEVDTWLRPAVWDAPNSYGINGTTPIDWNIARINHNIDSGDRDITVLGLKSETAGKLLNITRSGTQDEYNPGQMLRVTHYLLLNGNIDLVGESQLLQDSGSILAEESAGWLERDQQGKRNSFVYNYWSSPVSIQDAANNSGYTVGDILWDGTTASNPQTINFQGAYWAADGGKSNPITISTYWIWGFSPATANLYAEWDHVEAEGLLKTGEGYTMKGSDGTASITADQNYVFKGKPHNGDFELPIATGQNYLIGNPYPSAIDGHQFIDDNGGGNGVFDGTIYFWDHFIEVDHILAEYIGGYAYLTKTGATPAFSNDDRINEEGGTGKKLPGQYIPVGQGFMINTTGALGGDIKFKNSQRVYKRETGSGTSIFLSHENREKTSKQQQEEPPRIRLNFRSPTGYHRQILAAAIPTTTNGFDWGYDALLRDNSVEDMFWMIDEDKYVIQAVPDFNEDQVLPLGVRIKGQSEFTFKIDTLENWPADKPVYLKDNMNDSIHDLRKADYKGVSEVGEILDRFEIVFHKEPDQIIPEEPNPEAELTNIQIRYHHDNRELIIMNPDLIKINEVMIFDLVGKRIQDFKEIPQAKEIILDIRPIGSSVYIVKLLTPSGVKNIKFLMK